MSSRNDPPYFLDISMTSKRNLTVALMCIVLTIAVSACTPAGWDPSYVPGKQKPNVQNLPLYPGAQQVTIHRDNGNPTLPSRLISFQTTDKPADVLAFYRDTLTRDGWELNPITTPPPNTLYFGWSNGAKNAGFTLDVRAEIKDGGKTYVEVDLRSYPAL